MKDHQLISIIIPVYNGSNYMREAIDSALDQTYGNIEVIVVNDGSNDSTEEIAKSYGNKIRYYKKKNGGVASALNLAIEKAKGDYISWLSHDDVYYPDKIEKQVKFLMNNPELIFIYSDVEYIDSNGMAKETTNFKTQHDTKYLSSTLYPFFNGLLNGCGMLIKRSDIVGKGGFNTKLKTTNDYDMWLKLMKNHKYSYLPIIGVKYRLHSKQSTHSIETHNKESNEFWIKCIQSLKKDEILAFNPSAKQFYLKFALKMSHSRYIEAYDFSLNRYKKVNFSNLTEKQKQELNDYMQKELISREDRVQEQHRIMKLKTAKIDKLRGLLKNANAELNDIKSSKKYKLIKVTSPKAIARKLKSS